MIEAVVFDLDDTLYLERDYVRSGFAKVAETLEALGIARARVVFEHLWREFEAGRRGDAFDSLSLDFPFDDRISVLDLVDLYRAHQPTISLLDPDEFAALGRLPLPLGLISDGVVRAQLAKMEALGLLAGFDAVILTGRWGRDFWKPHPRAFETVEDELGMPGDRLAYVADNPAKDFIAPNRRGWTSIRLRMEGQLHYEAEPMQSDSHPQVELSSLAGLIRLLRL